MLAIIVVNYKNEEKTISFVRDELSKIDIPHIIVIVNNASTNESDIRLKNELKAELVTNIDTTPNLNSCFVISEKQNLGFAKGNNYGVEFAINHFNISHLLISNNDIRLISNNVVGILINKLDSMDDVALIGPKVVGLDNLNQSPEPYYPFWNRYFWMYWLTPFLSHKQKIKLFELEYSQTAKEGVHYKVMGSFFIVKKSDFLACGMMDPNTFLFSEEVILSERLKAIGKKVYYYPEVTILHEHGQTITKHLENRKKILTQFASECYYYSKYKNVSWLSILLGKLSLKLYLMIKK